MALSMESRLETIPQSQETGENCESQQHVGALVEGLIEATESTIVEIGIQEATTLPKHTAVLPVENDVDAHPRNDDLTEWSSDLDREKKEWPGGVSDKSSEFDEEDIHASEEREWGNTPLKHQKRSFQFKKYEAEAQKNFTKKGGIIYAPLDLWNRYYEFSYDCHLYVSSISTENPASLDQDRFGDSPGGVTTGNGKPLQHLRYGIPERVTIHNKRLRVEMAKIAGTSDHYNDHHVPPFRSIVPLVTQFRSLHQDKEKEFRETASLHPNHRAVLRSESWVPYDDNVDEIDKERHLLDGLRSLIFFLDNDLADLLDCYRNIEAGTIEKIPFAYLWHLFAAGQEIVLRKPNYQVCRVLKVIGGRKSLVPRKANSRNSNRRTTSDLTIDCFHLDFDGLQFRAVPMVVLIQPYEGLLDITSLTVYPLRYERGALEKRLIQRGEKFADLVCITHRRYKGLSLREGDIYDRHEEIDSDVVIDFELAFRSSVPRIETPDFEAGVINRPSEEDEEETSTHTDTGNGSASWLLFDDQQYVRSRWAKFVQHTSLLEPQPLDSRARDVMILLPYRIYGYVFLRRKWYPLDIDLIEPVIENKQDGFDKLILPQGHKDIVRALVKTHARVPITTRGEQLKNPAQREFDVVRGKGQGLIILLHGAPGVGKTSTAECVAANTGRPLFPITCGDIGGSTAQDVERNLERFFDLARKWGCVLLLDEADVFLSERIKGDIRQNSLVSVFLRVLEYYSGILILTTNRVGDFDEAIKSRVHCALYYPPLNKNNTLDVWRMNILFLQDQNRERASNIPIQFDRKEIMQFARDHWKEGNRWNGRQIKNAFQTAVALADFDNLKAECKSKAKLERRHFETVAVASAHFDRYLTEVRNTDQSRAKANEVRRDDLDHDIKGYRSRSHKKKSSRGKTSIPQWPKIGDSDGEESTTDSSGSESRDASESGSEAKHSEPRPSRKKNKEKDEGTSKKKGESSKSRSGDKKSKKQEEVKSSKSKGKSSKSKSSRKNSTKQESEGSSDSESVRYESGSD